MGGIRGLRGLWTGLAGTTLMVLSLGCNCAPREPVDTPDASVPALSDTSDASVPAPPAITSALGDRSALDGSPVTFTVTATGAPTLAYAWTLGGVVLPECSSSSCTFDAVWTDSGKMVSVTVSNGHPPAATSSAALTVTTADVPATITQPPAPQSVVQPARATFAVTASGTPAPSYQWQESLDDGGTWADLPQATGASYTTADTAVPQSGRRYRVKVTNQTRTPPAGTTTNVVTSDGVTLTVSLPQNVLVAKAVHAGNHLSYAIDLGGELWAWGEAVNLTTGHFEGSGNSAFYATRPVKVQGLSDVVAVASAAPGAQYVSASYALHGDGTVSAWGSNSSGQLGDRTVTDRVAPIKVLNGVSPIDQVCELVTSTGLLFLVRSEEADGACGAGKHQRAWVAGLFGGSSAGGATVAGLGANGAELQYVPGLPADASVRTIAAVSSREINGGALFFLEDGRVFAWGWSPDNALGAGDSTIVGLTGTIGAVDVSAFWSGVSRVSVGGYFSVGVAAGGGLVAVGRNAEGELGVGSVVYHRVTLEAVPGLSGTTSLSAGFRSLMAIAAGELWVWGDGWGYFPGLVSPYLVTSPRRVENLGGFTAVSVGYSHALVLGPGGAVYAFGVADMGQLGNGVLGGAPMTTPGPVTR